jgi:hypothetical protein
MPRSTRAQICTGRVQGPTPLRGEATRRGARFFSILGDRDTAGEMVDTGWPGGEELGRLLITDIMFNAPSLEK